MGRHPQVRTNAVIAEWLGSEVILYDGLTGQAHCLSGHAAQVWRVCTGTRTEAEMARELGLDAVTVQAVLTDLRRCGLMAEPDGVDVAASPPTYSRRETALRAARLTGAALGASLIASVTIGPAAAYASGMANGTSCVVPGDCGSGFCVGHVCCGTACNTPPTNETATCPGGACTYTCPQGFNTCGPNCVNLQADAMNCGQCGTICSSGQSGGTAVCSSGSCAISCNNSPYTTLCSGVCRDLKADPNNCGTCGKVCPGMTTCVNGACQ